jgi:hypothetical protein
MVVPGTGPALAQGQPALPAAPAAAVVPVVVPVVVIDLRADEPAPAAVPPAPPAPAAAPPAPAAVPPAPAAPAAPAAAPAAPAAASQETGRTATRQQFTTALTRDGRLQVAPIDASLAAVLHGPADAAERAALASIQAEPLARIVRADALRRSGDCQAALAEADAAIAALAAEQAAIGAAPEAAVVEHALAGAHGQVLACAHQRGEIDRALVAARRLRDLGGGELPPGASAVVTADLWRAYPPMDALGNAYILDLTVTTEPAGAQVWVDHRLVGTAPVTVAAVEGAHLVAAASGGRASSQQVEIDRKALPPAPWGQTQVMNVHLSLSPRAWAWQAEADEVARWRSTQAVDGAALGALLARLNARVALVLVDADARLVRSGAPGRQAVQIWAMAPGETEARRVGTGQLARPESVATRVVARVAGWDAMPAHASGQPSGASPEPGVPLLRESDVPRRYGSRPGARRLAHKPWWAYATIIGAVAATSLLILAADLGDDRQRIELRWP